MNPTRNPVTGDFMITGHATDAYKDGWERIFGNKNKVEEVNLEPKVETPQIKEPKISVTEFTGRRVFSVDVGDMSSEQAVEFVKYIREAFAKVSQ
jgi:capsular polysaccharide biosynthesis protein